MKFMMDMVMDYFGRLRIIVCDQVMASGSNYGDGETISFIAGCDQSLIVGCTDLNHQIMTKMPL